MCDDNGREPNTREAFTTDQQERVQELIDSAYKRAYAKATGRQPWMKYCPHCGTGLPEEKEE